MHTYKMHSKITSVILRNKQCIKSAKPSRVPTWLHSWLTRYGRLYIAVQTSSSNADYDQRA